MLRASFGVGSVGDEALQLIDLSHVIEGGMSTYPGLPGPVIGEHLGFDDSAAFYAAGTEFAIGRIELVGNTGTYLDTPAHRYRAGHDLAGLPLERCVNLPAVVVDAGPGSIGAERFDGLELHGAAVLLRTSWDQHWGTDRYGASDHPYLTATGARRLVDGGAALVGIDAVNIDDTTDRERPAHTILLGADIPVVEHLCRLGLLPSRGAFFTAVPPAVRGMGTFPVRAFAALP